MYNYLRLKECFLLFLLMTAGVVYGQQPVVLLTPAEKKQVIAAVIQKLTNVYVYPDMSRKMTTALSALEKKGSYDLISDPSAFAAKLREDLVAVSHDRHLNITFDPDWVQASKKTLSKQDSLELIHKDFPNARADNFGFKEVRVLDGNIGYLNLTKFYDPALGAETATAAMNFLANTDALIIDLRHNGGGYGDMVQLVASYLFDTEQVLILELYSREDDRHKQDWTLPYVPGKRMPEKPVYVLTGPETFSAAESFTYFLKNRKRATIIGEKTGGGAHPVHHQALSDRFSIFIPYGRPIDPITKTDWENTGVVPDIAVPVNDALLSAQAKALESLLALQPTNANAAWALAPLKAAQYPVVLPLDLLRSYEGSYSEGIRKLFLEDGKLYFQRTGQPKYALEPLAEDLFQVPALPYLRLKITKQGDKVTGFVRVYQDGSSFTEKRDY
ncbi:peptidase S41-like protein [Mucilaginibacter gracilis]|uniref:Peptidase S41-like protein n=1 Tax=Mucilaginibacter gracilis TaxID=423350 RepID=A0A495IZW2_9SPHI|nr:S41 family peptidase [Mucilaginibacter gracilis]RKR82063.1 peptidase S41-like protein [Mucilaginibacter gracilis]